MLFALATTHVWRAARELPPAEPQADTQPASTGAPAAAQSENLVAAAPTATLRDLLADPAFSMTADEAIGTLLTLWGGAYDAARREPCKQASEQGLRCLLQTRGSLGELKRINWPTIVSLVTGDRREHPVVIAALHHDTAEVVAHGKTYVLSLADLGLNWYGDHVLLWRPGNAPTRELVPGMDDVGVLWLRGMLARLNGADPPAAASTIYDASLAQQVKSYQREHQLAVDGIVGERTVIAILADLKLPDTPLLAVR